MVRRIHRLDSGTIDKIAAGEVIDFPSSCVKELIDNALDAEARNILVEVDLGGRERIVVTDDGCGMCREDVVGCIQSHTTSKLSSIEDLFSLSSRGFRGEALASIVAVAKVTITSAEHRGEETVCPGTVLIASGGEILSTQETQATPGTTVCVESLFYNVPARRKFLKSPTKDAQDIIKIVTMLAFSAPDVSFKLIVDGKLRLSAEAVSDRPCAQSSATSCCAKRAKQLFGSIFDKDSKEIDYHDQQFSITGLLGSLHNSRSNRSLQYLLINGRPVVSVLISYVVKAACGTAIEQTKHPVFALSIQMDPSMIDINVHPQKREVRFADEESVRSVVYQAVLKSLFGMQEVAIASPCQVSSFSVKPDINTVFTAKKPPLYDQAMPAPVSICRTSMETRVTPPIPPCTIAKPPSLETEILCLAIIGDIALIQPVSLDHNTPLIALDLRATMRTLLYSHTPSSQQAISSQTLLIPVPFQVSPCEEELLQQALPQLQQMGFSLRPFGHNSFLIETVPTYLKEIDVVAFILDALHDGIVTKHDLYVQERRMRVVHAQVAAMKELQSPISKEFAITVYTSWHSQGRPKTAPDGAFCYALITPQALKSSIAKGDIALCQA